MKEKVTTWLKNKKTYIVFTLCFGLVVIPLLWNSIQNQTLLLCGGDGRTQHYPSYVYISQWLKVVFSNLLHFKWAIPMMDLSLGMGDDIWVTLNYYGFGDVFNFLSMFIPKEGLPYFFSFLFYLRMYIAGIVFIAFCRLRFPEKDWLAYVTSAFLYVFSGFSMMGNVHVIMLHALIYIPFMIYGAERIFTDGKKRWLAMAVCLQAMAGFFFLYCGSIALGIYSIVRCIELYRKDIWAGIKKVRDEILSYILGITLSAFIFLPELLGYLRCNRSGEHGYYFWYSVHEYKERLLALFMANELNAQPFALAAIGILSIIVVFLCEKKWKEKIGTLLILFAFSSPFLCWIMSGFSYCYDRWEVILVFAFSCVFFCIWEQLIRISKAELVGIISFSLLYLLLCRYDPLLEGINATRVGKVFIVYCVFFVVAYFIRKLPHASYIVSYWLFVLSVITIGLNWKWNAKYDLVSNVNEPTIVNDLLPEDDSFFRVENERVFGENRNALNLALNQNYYGTAEYFSIENGYYTRALDELDVSALEYTHAGLDRRAIIDTLATVKYYVLESTHAEDIVPFGYKYIDSTPDEKWSIYQNQYYLPLGYTYKQVIKQNEFLELDGIQKQDVMLEYASIDGYEGELPLEEVTPIDYKLQECRIIDGENVEWQGDTVVTQAGSTLRLSVPMTGKCENYLMFSFPPGYSYIEYAGTVLYPRYSQMVTLGYVEQSQNVEIVLHTPATWSITSEQIKVVSYDVSKYAEKIQLLSEDSLENIRIETNTVLGTIDCSQDEVLCIAIPYNIGWHLYVDGEKVKNYRINSLFMGTDLKKGFHEIKLVYRTPGILAGTGISVFAIMGMVVYWYISKKKKVAESN